MNCKRIILCLFLLLLIFMLSICELSLVNVIFEVIRVINEDFVDEEKVVVELVEGLELKFWVFGLFLFNVVVFIFD